jgi:hypothetical protein
VKNKKIVIVLMIREALTDVAYSERVTGTGEDNCVVVIIGVHNKVVGLVAGNWHRMTQLQ